MRGVGQGTLRLLVTAWNYCRLPNNREEKPLEGEVLSKGALHATNAAKSRTQGPPFSQSISQGNWLPSPLSSACWR